MERGEEGRQEGGEGGRGGKGWEGGEVRVYYLYLAAFLWSTIVVWP